MATARPKAWVCWSSGKDSAWALHVVRQAGEMDVVGLLTTVNSARQRVTMHDVRGELLRAQAQATGLPLIPVSIPWPCENADYESAMSRAVDEALRAGVTQMVFGDLFLEDVRRYREARLEGSGLTAQFPLWQRSTHRLAEEMVEAGLQARVVCVDTRSLSADFAGREFDGAFLRDLPADVDPCGERGEFHTFCYGGPMFSTPISLRAGASRHADGFAFADLLPA